jgi:hypothetical protein
MTITSFAAGIVPGSYNFEGTGVGHPDFVPDGWLVEGLLVWDGGTTPEAFKGSWINTTSINPICCATSGYQPLWGEFLYAYVNTEGATMTAFALSEWGSAPDLIQFAMTFQGLNATYEYDWLGTHDSSRGGLTLRRVPGQVPEPGTGLGLHPISETEK